jgi:ATP-dependent Clp protease ATP-binding subunit ClpC
MFERFTDRARRVVVLAQEEARMLNHNYIGTEHILLGLIHEGEGVAAKALESMNISLDAVREQVQEIIGQGQAAPTGHIPFTPRAKKVLELSLREALQLGHNYIGTEHILLGLIREGEGVAAQVLQKLGAAGRLGRARPVRPKPHAARARIQARPGDRAREGDRARDAGAVTAHEEQPRADR